MMTYEEAVKLFKNDYKTVWETGEIQEIRWCWNIFKEDAFANNWISMRDAIIWEMPKK